jgi:hypothetical protein
MRMLLLAKAKGKSSSARVGLPLDRRGRGTVCGRSVSRTGENGPFWSALITKMIAPKDRRLVAMRAVELQPRVWKRRLHGSFQGLSRCYGGCFCDSLCEYKFLLAFRTIQKPSGHKCAPLITNGASYEARVAYPAWGIWERQSPYAAFHWLSIGVRGARHLLQPCL